MSVIQVVAVFGTQQAQVCKIDGATAVCTEAAVWRGWLAGLFLGAEMAVLCLPHMSAYSTYYYHFPLFLCSQHVRGREPHFRNHVGSSGFLREEEK